MSRLLERLLNRHVTTGSLTIKLGSGRHLQAGDGTGQPVVVRLPSEIALWKVLLDPDLRLGEAHADGILTMESGSIADLLSLGLSQPTASGAGNWGRFAFGLRYLVRRLQQANGRTRARRNVAHHYDLGARLYDLFLDPDRQYSCGYFASSGDSLEEAQVAKKRHIAAKLCLGPSARVLDIGSGWGGLALYLAETCGAGQVTGITLSQEQLTLSRARTAAKGLDERVSFLLQDYRDLDGPFDRIVSVGMFEHVGVGHYDRYFRKCAEMLRDDGIMLLHAIGRSDPPGITNPWIAKYIFPGGYIPALSEVLPAIERAGLLVTDVEILRLHYAETLKHWRARFLEERQAAARLYDERFVRLWEFYLAASEMAFREEAMMIFQIQIAKRQYAVPLTRDYIGREEARLKELERRHHFPHQIAAE